MPIKSYLGNTFGGLARTPLLGILRVKHVYDLESLGLKDDNERSVYSNSVKGMARKEGRYEVSLLWHENMPTLPSNYDVCVCQD